jgi:hypothetical protein
MRFHTYGVALGPEGERYCRTVRGAPGVRAWIEGALEEKEIVAEDEIYATRAPAA